MSKRYDLLLRLLLVGETGVGKTCLLCKYINQDFISAHISTIGIDFKMKTLQINDRVVKVQIWDTAGQERFESITKQFYRRAQGVLLVYDMSSRSSFEAIPKWLAHVEQFCKEDVSVMLLGNKCDREDRRQVTTKEASQFAKEHGIMFSETSAKSSSNLEKAFLDMCTDIIESQEQQASESRSSISLDEDSSHFDSHSDSSQLLSDGGRKRCC
ncbi:Ras-related protein Rab-15 [Mytilus galloprovincialis]|uniref:Ras-related protein Rab-15 n=1 Tax=Mytilus galloprovincialis TaxID=29158 RepID=A0A8B6C4S7_MYTGA|nr:Ras-related protein Rab-15 [Mytilus galloprovincialis]